MIKIVDYGLGNISAFLNMYKRMNIAAAAARDADQLAGASKIILPGVGAFDHAMERLEASGMRPLLETMVRGQRIPALGVCVGMQMLAEASDEGSRAGLGWVPGRVRAFAGTPAAAGLPTPHMGWNDVRPLAPLALFEGLQQDARFYFLHSYYFDARDPAHIAATASYGLDFPCVVHADNVYGVQCHPEKSHHWGARLLKNFAEL